MPWKKVPVQSTKTRKVPQSWLETDMSQGLSSSDIDGRRARFGYNELERYVTQTLSLHWNAYHSCKQSENQPHRPVCRVFSRPNTFRCVRPLQTLFPTDVPLTVMELAVLLAAGLRDWIDFGVIVRLCSMTSSFFFLTGNTRLGFLCSTHLLAGFRRNKPAISSKN
jgi:H+-transporting ATPase